MTREKWVLSQAITTCFILILVSAVTAQQSDGQPEGQTQEIWDVLYAVSEAVEESHIAAPTRQQMFLAASRALYNSADKNSPTNLAKQYTACTSVQELKEQFDQCLEDVMDDVDEQTLIVPAANAMIRASGINRGRFISAKEYYVQKSLSENQYVGIGIQLAMHEDMPVITRPYWGGAAYNAGSRPGDLIEELMGLRPKEKTLGQIVEALRGPKDSKVKVKLRNKDDQRVIEKTLIRSTIPLPTVQGTKRNDDGSWQFAMLDVKANQESSIAYLKFNSVVGSTAAEFNQLGQQILQQGFSSVVLDFRTVSAAEIHHANMLANSLLEEAVLGTVQSSHGEQQLSTRPGMTLGELPVAVLAPPGLDGSMYMLMANLRERPNTIFVGDTLRSDAISGELVELEGGLGAIQNMPTSICRPQVNRMRTNEIVTNTAGSQLGMTFGQSIFALPPDVENDQTGYGAFAGCNGSAWRSGSRNELR